MIRISYALTYYVINEIVLQLSFWVKSCLTSMGSNMKAFQFFRLNPLIALLVALPMAQVAGDPFINGSFEDGVTGWELRLDGSFSSLYYLDGPQEPIDPFDIPFVIEKLSSQVFSSPYYDPLDGGKVGVINNVQSKGDYLFTYNGRTLRWTPNSYTIMVGQTFDVPEDTIISGWGRLQTWDFPPYQDKAFVTIDGVEIWKNSVEDVVKNYIGTSTLGPWDQWSAKLGPGQHTIVLGATGDTDKDSIGIFDGIRTSAVPDSGCTGVLLSLSAVGLFALKRVRVH